jgi:eukaryotic-like serine/threonine-protein kinase
VSHPKASATPDPEEIAGRYQVVKRLGAGAFGTVYKVKDKVLGRMLAIKTIRMEGLAASGASIEELIDRFKREAQISAQLRHPNIVTIYDVGDVDGMSYLAMEFIDGVGLERVIAAAGRLPLERAALIGAQVADALDFAHRHSVVHRDIKPANIMIEAGDRVKVTDFGIAKVTDSGEHLTMTGSLLGTPSYMSPEQARGAKLDGRSDLFAVGAILYEMLAGQKAFRGDSITGLIFKIITEEPQLITELDPTIPPEMVQVIQRALSKAPEQRYQTGREMAEDLLAFTRTGSSPTLRQGEIDTLRGGGGAAAPTFSGQSPTVANAATQGRAAATEITPPGAPAAPPRPVEPT